VSKNHQKLEPLALKKSFGVIIYGFLVACLNRGLEIAKMITVMIAAGT
jgi:hypothetical protein